MKIGVSWIIYLRFESNTHETHQNGCDMTLNITTFHNPLKSYARIGRVSGSDDDNEMQTLVGIVVNLCVYVHCMCLYVCVCIRLYLSAVLFPFSFFFCPFAMPIKAGCDTLQLHKYHSQPFLMTL